MPWVARSLAGVSQRVVPIRPALGIERVGHVAVGGGFDADADLLVLRSSRAWRMCR